MSDKKQTAVEWLAEQMMHPQIHNPFIEQAKEMERQQMMNAFDEGVESDYYSQFENYYTQTYKP